MTKKHDESRYVDIVKKDRRGKILEINPYSTKERFALPKVDRYNEELTEIELERGDSWGIRFPATKPHPKPPSPIRPFQRRSK